jgi:hypothetical protein
MEESINDLIARITATYINSVYVTLEELERLIKVRRVMYSPDTLSFILPYKCYGGACKYKIILTKRQPTES